MQTEPVQTPARPAIGSWSLEQEAGVMSLSSGLCHLLGLTADQGHLTHQEFLDTFVFPEEKYWVGEYQRNGYKNPYEFRICRTDGEIRWVMALPSEETTNPCAGLLLDGTERRQMTNEQQYTRKMESIRSIAGGIAHEFNNIFYTMSGYLGLIQEITADNPIDPNEIRSYVAELQTSHQRAVTLIRRIQAFSHSASAKTVIFNMGETTAHAISQNGATNISMNLDRTVLVSGDPVIYNEIVQALLSNARLALNDHTGRITVTVRPFFAARTCKLPCGRLDIGHYGLLEVTDNGVGMDEESVTRIFDPFYTTRPVGQGLGLGLSIAYGGVRAADGAIDVATTPGAGTTMSLYLRATPEKGSAT